MKITEVNIRKSGNGYLIVITDQFTKNSLAITRLELEKIILYGQKILNENPDPIKTEPHIHPGDTSECFCKNENPK